jgi:hypothetical protein
MRFTVDENLIRASAELSVDYGAVNDCEYSTIVGFDVGVIPRRARIVEYYCIVRRSANCANGLGNKTELPLTPTCVGDFEVRHAELDPNMRTDER